MYRREKFILRTLWCARAQSRASHDKACLKQNKASSIVCLKKKKKRKKKLGKETNGTWLRRGILLALNAQWNVCSKKVFNQTEKVVSVIAQACAIKAVDLFESTATEFWIYVFIYVSLHLRFYCKRILLKKTINHLQPLKSKPNVKIYFAKKC